MEQSTGGYPDQVLGNKFETLDAMILLHGDVSYPSEGFNSVLCDGRSEENGNLTKMGDISMC